jgi:hypothetical protein
MITACLITYKRQYNISKIVESLLRWPFIDEIIIRDNSKSENIINYGRYDSALRAKNDIIYTQDDDYIVNNVDKLYETFVDHPDMLVHSGNKSYENDIPNNIHGDKQMAIVGWGAIFNRKWIPVLDKYIQKYGKDYCFFRETDRIFSILLGKHHLFVPGNLQELEGANNQDALCNQGEHIKYKKMAIERALSL